MPILIHLNMLLGPPLAEQLKETLSPDVAVWLVGWIVTLSLGDTACNKKETNIAIKPLISLPQNQQMSLKRGSVNCGFYT